jgi:hypothetical protein
MALLTFSPQPDWQEAIRPLLLPIGMTSLGEIRSFTLRGRLDEQLQLNLVVRLPEGEAARHQTRESLRRLRTLAGGLALVQPDPLWSLLSESQVQEEPDEWILQTQTVPAPILRRISEEFSRRGW